MLRLWIVREKERGRGEREKRGLQENPSAILFSSLFFSFESIVLSFLSFKQQKKETLSDNRECVKTSEIEREIEREGGEREAKNGRKSHQSHQKTHSSPLPPLSLSVNPLFPNGIPFPSLSLL